MSENENTAHYFEEAVRVYLCWNQEEGAWEIDPVTFDGSPLFSDYDGVEEAECQCDCDDEATRDEHDAELKRAEAADLPDAWQLRDLLIKAAEKLR